MLKPLVILGLSLAFAGCATNSTAPASTSDEAEKVAKEDDKKKKVICKRTARVGTNFKTTQCWTAEEYAQKQKDDKELIRNMQKNGRMKGPEGR